MPNLGAMRPNLPALTSLRFFASLLVVFFHYNNNAKGLPLPYGVTHFGYEAVTFFFVLSGFILTYVHLAEDDLNLNPRDFTYRRIARLAPSYLLD